MTMGRNVLVALCLLMSLALSSSAPGYAGASEEAVEEALAQGRGGGMEGVEEEKEDEVLPLQAVPDPILASLDSRLPFYVPEFLPEDFDDSADTAFYPAPLKRGRYNRLDILKRSRLNQLIHRLLAMRGDRYSYHRASPVRFAAGRR